MTDIRSLLAKGAEEIRLWDEPGVEPAWLNRLALRMEQAAASLESTLEREVAAITHSLVDSGPIGEACCPSFWQVAGYFQRQRKRSL